MIKLREAVSRNVFLLLFYPPLPSCLDVLVRVPCRHGQLNEPTVNVFLIPILPTLTFLEFYYNNTADGDSFACIALMYAIVASYG